MFIYHLVKTMRSSILVLGPLLARFGQGQLTQVAAGHAARDDGGHTERAGARERFDVHARAGHEDGACGTDVDARRGQLDLGSVDRDHDAAVAGGRDGHRHSRGQQAGEDPR